MCLLHEDPVRPSYQTTLLSSNLPFPRKGLASGDRTQAVRLAQQTLSPQSHFTSPEQFVIRIFCYTWPNVTGSKRWHSRPQKLKCGFTEFDWAGLALFVGFEVSLGLWKRQQYSKETWQMEDILVIRRMWHSSSRRVITPRQTGCGSSDLWLYCLSPQNLGLT